MFHPRNRSFKCVMLLSDRSNLLLIRGAEVQSKCQPSELLNCEMLLWPRSMTELFTSWARCTGHVSTSVKLLYDKSINVSLVRLAVTSNRCSPRDDMWFTRKDTATSSVRLSNKPFCSDVSPFPIATKYLSSCNRVKQLSGSLVRNWLLYSHRDWSHSIWQMYSGTTVNGVLPISNTVTFDATLDKYTLISCGRDVSVVLLPQCMFRPEYIYLYIFRPESNGSLPAGLRV